MIYASVVIDAPFSSRIVEEEKDASRDLQPDDILVETEVSLVTAGVESAVFSGRLPGLIGSKLFRGYPWQPGHAAVGRVACVGSSVQSVSAGERILFLGRHANPQVVKVGGRGLTSLAFPVPREISAEDAVLARLVKIGVAVSRAASIRSKETVVVLGLGLVGNLVAQVLQGQGANVLGVSTSPFRARIATDSSLIARAGPREAQPAFVKSFTGGDLADVVVDSVCSPESFHAAALSCREGGRLVLVGTPREEFPSPGTVFQLLRQRGVSLIGCYEWTLAPSLFAVRQPSLWWDYVTATALLARGRIRTKHLMTDRLTPEQLPGMYCELAANWASHLGVVVHWRRDDRRDGIGA